MDLVVYILVASAISWVTLMIVMPIVGRMAEFSFPGWKETAWRLAAVALSVNVVNVLLAPVSGWLAWIAAVILFWVLMYKWFDMNFIGAVLIVAISWFVRIILVGMLLAAGG